MSAGSRAVLGRHPRTRLVGASAALVVGALVTGLGVLLPSPVHAAECGVPLGYTIDRDTQDPHPGDTVHYLVLLTNEGDAIAQSAGITIDLASVLDDASWDGSATSVGGRTSTTASTISWAGAIRAGAAVRIEFTATWTGKGDGIAFPSVPSFGDTTGCSAPRLEVTKEDFQNDVVPGQTLPYRIAVRNTGTADAVGVVLTDALPAGLSYVSASAPPGISVDAVGQTVTARIGRVAAGQTVTLVVNARVADNAPAGTLKNTACAAGDNAPRACGSDTDNVLTPVFQYTFNEEPSPPAVGDTVSFRVEITNSGSIDAPQAELAFDVRDIVDDATWRPSTISADGGKATVDGTVVDWRGPLHAGDRVVITFTGVWTGSGDGLAFPDVTYIGPAR